MPRPGPPTPYRAITPSTTSTSPDTSEPPTSAASTPSFTASLGRPADRDGHVEEELHDRYGRGTHGGTSAGSVNAGWRVDSSPPWVGPCARGGRPGRRYPRL